MIKQNVTSFMLGNPPAGILVYYFRSLCISMTVSVPPVLVQLSCCI